MTISGTATSITADGDGLTTVFNYDFYMGGSSSYAVLVYVDADGVSTTIATADFTITGVTSQAGGTFTYPLVGSPIATGATLTLSRVLPIVQGAAIANQGNLYPSVIEQAFDYQTMVSQQLAEGAGQTIDANALFGNPSASSGPGVSVPLGSGLTFSGGSIVVSGISGSGTVTQINTGTGLSGGPITGVGTVTLATITSGYVLANFSGATAAPSGQAFPTITPQGRLTLTSATPVMTASVTSGTTIYYTPYVGNCVPLYDGVSMVPTVFTELSQLTTDATKSPAAVTTSSNYDIFAWVDSGTLRGTRGPLWSSATSRGTGAGTTELTMVKGILLNANTITNGPSAQRGTYLGSVRSNASSQIATIFGGTGASGGESSVLGVWNAYNRVPTRILNLDTTASFVYTTNTYRIKNGSTSNRISFICGLGGESYSAQNPMDAANSTTDIRRDVTIGLDSDLTASLAASGFINTAAANVFVSMLATYTDAMPLGFHYVAPLERSTATGACTWSPGLSPFRMMCSA